MTEERITETTDSLGRTHTTHTVVHGSEPRSGGGGSWAVMLAVLALVAGVIFFTQMSGAEVAKDTAVADAAAEVGEAANQVGQAAEDAGAALEDAVQN